MRDSRPSTSTASGAGGARRRRWPGPSPATGRSSAPSTSGTPKGRTPTAPCSAPAKSISSHALTKNEGSGRGQAHHVPHVTPPSAAYPRRGPRRAGADSSPVDCPRCGAPIDAMPCPVCGARAAGRRARACSTTPAGGAASARPCVDNLILFVRPVGRLPAWATPSPTPSSRGARPGRPGGVHRGAALAAPAARPWATGSWARACATPRTLQPITASPSLLRWLVMALYLTPEFTTARGRAARRRAIAAVLDPAIVADDLYPLVSARRQTWHDRIARHRRA